MKKVFLSVTVILIILFSCNKSDEVEDKQENNLLSEKARNVVSANNQFAFEFFSQIANNEEEPNYMVSPVSLSLALGMAYNGSDGSTKTAFENVMHYNLPLIETNQVNKDLIDHLSSNSNGSVMEIANSIWADNSFPIKENFIDLNTKYYYAEVSNLDFGNSESVDVINEWVANKTHDKIPTIIESIPFGTKMYLINAIYFNSIWKYEFDPNESIISPFYKTPTETINVEMMTYTENLSYLQNDLFRSVILPYQNDKYSMVLLLPNLNKTTEDIVEVLNTSNWNNWLSNYSTEEVPVFLPKFKFDYKNLLNDELIDLGLGVAFSDNADFSNLSDIDVFISTVLQKTYIDVNEIGTEAAAVTSISFEFTAAPETPNFNANKPFVYVIKENTTGSICFIGKVGEPEYEE